MNETSAAIKEFYKFYQFYTQVILAHQHASFVPISEFHKGLMLTACMPITATAAPRGFLKTEIFSRYRSLHRLVDPTPNLTAGSIVEVLIVSETMKMAREHIAWIKSQLTDNPFLLAQYGNLTDPTHLKWNEDEITLTNGNRCIALGYGSQIRGRHPTDIMVDDLESLGNMATEESLSKLKDWFYKVLMGAMVPETRLSVIGTIIAPDSLLMELVRKPEFKGKIWKALNRPDPTKDEYTSLWEQRWPVSDLLKRRALLGVHRFNNEYQNEPLGSGDAIIQPEWVKRHTDNDLIHMVPTARYITCDPAFTEERWGDWSAIIVLDEMQDGRLFERLAWRKKVGAPELIENFMSIVNHYSRDVGTVRIGIEEVAAQKAVRQMIMDKDPDMGSMIIPLRPDKDKTRRLVAVSRYFEWRLVSLKTEWLFQDLLQFPHGAKDGVDALVYGLKLYEQEHPTAQANKYVELDMTRQLGDTDLSWYMEKRGMGLPGYEQNKQLLRNYDEALMISSLVEDFF